MSGFWAGEGRVARVTIEGGVEVTEQQYRDAVDAMLEGREVTIDGGFLVRDRAPSPAHIWEDNEWVLPVPEPEPDPEPLPPLTPRQLRLMMLQIGLTDADVIAQIDLIADAEEKAAAMIEWQWATRYDRDHPLVGSLATALAFEPAELDALWVYAADI